MWPFTPRNRAQKVEPATPAPPVDPLEALQCERRAVQARLATLDREFCSLRFKYFSTMKNGHTKLATKDHAESARVLAEQRRIFTERDRLKAKFDFLNGEIALLVVPRFHRRSNA